MVKTPSSACEPDTRLANWSTFGTNEPGRLFTIAYWALAALQARLVPASSANLRVPRIFPAPSFLLITRTTRRGDFRRSRFRHDSLRLGSGHDLDMHTQCREGLTWCTRRPPFL